MNKQKRPAEELRLMEILMKRHIDNGASLDEAARRARIELADSESLLRADCYKRRM